MVKPTGFALYYIVFGSVVLILMLIVRRRRQVRENSLPDYYRKFQKRCEKKGLVRSAGESYRAFHLRIKIQNLELTVVKEFDAAIERDLYAATGISGAERGRLSRVLKWRG